MDKVRILVGDKVELVAEGMKNLLKDVPEMEVVGYASTGLKLLEFLKNDQVDLVVLDVALPEMDGIDTARAIRKAYPAQVMLAHSSLTGIEYINSMLIEGCSGYLIKGAEKDEFLEAIRVVVDGGQYMSPAAKQTVETGYKHTEKHMDGEYIGLTQREKEIIKLIAREKTNQEIAAELFVSVETVKSHRKNLMTKLNVKSIAGLVKYAVDRCWI
jgi:DNA-binding NarL/FixJ family response regulator